MNFMGCLRADVQAAYTRAIWMSPSCSKQSPTSIMFAGYFAFQCFAFGVGASMPLMIAFMLKKKRPA